MFLRRLCIKNYKSLKNVDFCPTNLSVLVGPNGAGKSNFASAIDFLSDVYRHGLEAAVTRKGGYENIAFRAERLSRSAIRFEVTIELARAESIMLNQFHAIAGVPPAAPVDEKAGFRLTHRFSFKAQKHGIDGDFKIEDESFDVRVKRVAGGPAGDYILEAELGRTNDGRISLNFPRGGPQLHELREYVGHEVEMINRSRQGLGQQQLFATIPSLEYPGQLTSQVANCRVFHIDPLMARGAGVPTPSPSLSMTGENLPAVVASMKKREKGVWFEVLQTMREIVPGLEDIEASYLHTKTLGLFFKERTSATPWAAEDVSDGTIHALSLLVASVDAESSALVIEEIENSAHPWIIRTLIERFRRVSEGKSVVQEKSVVLTTHSPIVVDAFRPNETWVVYKKGGGTRVKNILDIDPTIGPAWEGGEFGLSDYLDSGLLPHAVPGGDV